MVRVSAANPIAAAQEIRRFALLHQHPIYVRRSCRGYAIDEQFSTKFTEQYIGTYSATASVLDIAADILADR